MMDFRIKYGDLIVRISGEEYLTKKILDELKFMSTTDKSEDVKLDILSSKK